MRKILAAMLFLAASLSAQVLNPPIQPGTIGDCAEYVGQYSIGDAGAPCGGGSAAFSAITSGTNTAATMTVGTGASLLASGTGTITATNGVTTPNASDSSTAAATNQFVQDAVQLSMATVPLSNITGGTYSFDSHGSGATVVVGVSGGAVTSIITWSGGTGYAVGDLITVNAVGSNFDAYIVITAIGGGGAPTSGTILYGGTGYASFGGFSAAPAISSIPFTFLLSGTLTSNAQLIMTHGTYLTQSNQWIFANNTTGAFTTNICVAGATDACSGGRTVTIAQGTNNSTSRLLQTDGELNVDSSEAGLLLAGLPASFSSIISGTVKATNYLNASGTSIIPTFGIATLSFGTVTVSNAAACTPSATCVYKLTNCALNGSTAIGVPGIGTISVGTSFVINSYTAIAGVAVDSSLICWQIN